MDKAGRDSELARQKLLKGKEIKRDFEKRALGNFASVAESGATTRKFAGALAWCTSNTSRGAGGSNGGFSAGIVAAATNGTQRTFTEALVKSVLATAFTNGATLSQAYVDGTHKQQFSAFTGIADIRSEVKGKDTGVIIAAADVYVSDFGAISIIPHAYAPLTRDAFFCDPSLWAISTLDGLKSTPLAKTGDNERFLLTMEKTLEAKNEKGGAVVADLL